jgi:hypothetical protein
LPSWATLVAWLGVIGTILGIVGFFISDLPGFTGTDDPGLSEESIMATFAALQGEKDQAYLQLTQIALANQQAANEATQQALAQQEANFQGTLAAIRAEQDAFLATRNAIAAASATADAANLAATAAADAANATATQDVLNVTATAAFIAQITPTPTETPTLVPTPEPVNDYRALTGADVRLNNQGMLEFSAQTADVIPNEPPETLSYIWVLDTDQSAATGQEFQGLGIDMQVTVRYENGAWLGTVRRVQSDGTLGDPFLFFPDVNANGPNLTAGVSAAEMGLASLADWIARSELDGEMVSFYPLEGHGTFTP